MAFCAMVTAMAEDRSLRASDCALAGVTIAQARPTAARRYDTTDMMESSPSWSRPLWWNWRSARRSLAHLSRFVRPDMGFTARASDVVSAGGEKGRTADEWARGASWLPAVVAFLARPWSRHS